MRIKTAIGDMPRAGRAAIRGGIWGNFVDQINIFLPVAALAPALPYLAGKNAVAQSAAFVIMATLIGRPLGAIIFGRLADRLGRTSMTKLAIGGTAVCTLLIACVPTHRCWGGWTIVAIIALRFIGGIFLAGEYSAAIPLAMEWSVPKKRGLWSGLIMSMSPWAQASIAFVTAILISALGPDSYARWGWRASFVAGGTASLIMLAYYIRKVADAPIMFKQKHQESDTTKAGLHEVLFGQWRNGFWQMFGLMTGLWFLTQMVVIVLAKRLVIDAHLSHKDASIAMGCSSVGQALLMACTGHLSSKVGRRRLLVGWSILAFITAPLLWLWTTSQRSLAPATLGAIALQLVTVCAYGPIGAYLTERFPARVRSTGYGTAYSLSIIIPALYPYYLPTMEKYLGHQGAPVALIVLGSGLVCLCALLGPALGTDEINNDVETVASRQKM